MLLFDFFKYLEKMGLTPWEKRSPEASQEHTRVLRISSGWVQGAGRTGATLALGSGISQHLSRWFSCLRSSRKPGEDRQPIRGFAAGFPKMCNMNPSGYGNCCQGTWGSVVV